MDTCIVMQEYEFLCPLTEEGPAGCKPGRGEGEESAGKPRKIGKKRRAFFLIILYNTRDNEDW